MPEPHPAVSKILQHFDYSHEKPRMQRISQPFYAIAHAFAEDPNLDGPELTVGLRKLLEARDCVVRAAKPPGRVTAAPRRPHRLSDD